MKEETGLDVSVEKLLYVCDVPSTAYSLIHMTFLLKREGGTIQLPTNEFDENPIADVKFVPLETLMDYGFSKKFMELVKDGFKDAGNYMGDKSAIGLD